MRRRFIRPIRRMLSRDIPPVLVRANQAMSAGNFVDAAADLELLARAAEARGGHRAPMLYVQAGRARLLAGQTAQSIELFQRGFGLLAARGRPRRLARLGTRVVAELQQRGLDTESRQLSDYLDNLSPGFGASAALPASTSRPPLPTHCPGCGAPVRPDEVEWLDDITAECAFCGSPLRKE